MSTHWAWRVFLSHRSQYFLIGQSWMVQTNILKKSTPPYFNTTHLLLWFLFSSALEKDCAFVQSIFVLSFSPPPLFPVIARISYSINYPLVSHTEKFLLLNSSLLGVKSSLQFIFPCSTEFSSVFLSVSK